MFGEKFQRARLGQLGCRFVPGTALVAVEVDEFTHGVGLFVQ